MARMAATYGPERVARAGTTPSGTTAAGTDDAGRVYRRCACRNPDMAIRATQAHPTIDRALQVQHRVGAWTDDTWSGHYWSSDDWTTAY